MGVNPDIHGTASIDFMWPAGGRVVEVCDSVEALSIRNEMKQVGLGRSATLFGNIDKDIVDVVLEMEFGDLRYLGALTDDPLPRIC